jgi:formylglycine-generating enzyme required for sulfatase activity
MDKQPPTNLWDTLPAIVKKLRNEFLLVTIAWWLLAIVIGFYVPGVVDLLGREFFILIVVFGFVAYLISVIIRGFLDYQQIRQQATQPGPTESAKPVAVALEPLPPAPEPPKARTSSEALRERYLRLLRDQCIHLQMTTIDRKAATRREAAALDLAAVFTDLDVHDVGFRERDARQKGAPPTEEEQADRRLPVLAALSRYAPRMVLLGDPGSGKSTLVRFITLCLAGDWLGEANANQARLGDAWTMGRLLPVRVILRDYAARGLPRNLGLWAFIGAELKRTEPDGPLRDCLPVLEAHLKQKDGAILLLDGVDEVPEAHRYRLRLKEAVEQFARDYPHCRILVTSRPYAYQDPDAYLAGFEVRRLAPFTPEQVQAFIHRWYEHVGQKDPALGPDNAARYAEQLAHAVETNPRLADLAPNPLILTLMASLHRWREGGSLPEKRQELYEQSVELLIDLWQRPKQLFDSQGNPAGEEYDVFTELGIPRDSLRAALNRAAYRAHRDQPETTGTHDILARDLAGELYEAATDKGKAEGQQRIIQYLIDRAGLLIEREQGKVYTFPHRTFQEYLAASYLADENYPFVLLERLREDDARWREATLLAAAKAGRSAIWYLLETFCPQDWSSSLSPANADWYAALRAAQALLEVEMQPLHVSSDRQRCSLERLGGWLAALLESSSLPAPERAAAGRALAELGDPRLGVSVSPESGLPSIQWCYIPPGTFQMGSRKEDDKEAYDDEQPQHEQNVPYPYWLACMPVTNVQFQAFVDDPQGYLGDDWWTRAGLSWRKDRTAPQKYGGAFDLPNHPAVMITWYEALAWCRWLTHRLRGKGSLPDDWEIRLPSEAEWEKAARGGLNIPGQHVISGDLRGPIPDIQSLVTNPHPTRRLPWGDEHDPDRANYAATGIGSTSAVGCFPGGVSPYGCLDMSGNVWEWCATKWIGDYQDYAAEEDNDPEGDYRRVVRGGAFYDTWGVRCAYRYGYVPVALLRGRGFRPAAAPVRL